MDLPPEDEGIGEAIVITTPTRMDGDVAVANLSALQRKAKAIASEYADGEDVHVEDLKSLVGAGILATLVSLVEMVDGGEIRNPTEAVQVLKGLTGFAGYIDLIDGFNKANAIEDPAQRRAALADLKAKAVSYGRAAAK